MQCFAVGCDNGALVLNNSGTIKVQLQANGVSYLNTGNNFCIGATSSPLSVTGVISGTSNISVAGIGQILSGTACSAGGTQDFGYLLSSTAHFGIFCGSGAPSLSAAKGSLYLRSDGTANNRLYINTDGSTTWTAFNTTSWLLKRDLDPAANDNAPAFLMENVA